MAQYKVTLQAASITQLQAQLKKLGIEASVEKINLSPSRADRLSEVESAVEDAKSTVEELRDEIQNWYDSLPENLQGGDKASQLEEAVSALEELSSNLEQCDFSGIEFPSMMG